jgi:hypothetical protein
MEDPPSLEPEQGYLQPSAFFAEMTLILQVPFVLLPSLIIIYGDIKLTDFD